jgi:hypothetical protein
MENTTFQCWYICYGGNSYSCNKGMGFNCEIKKRDQINFMVGSIISIYRFEAEVKVALLSWLTSKECF